MEWIEAGREHTSLQQAFTCAPRQARGTAASPYRKRPSLEPWAAVVQAELRKVRLPVKAPWSYQVQLDDDKSQFNAVFVWQYRILTDSTSEATLVLEFLATHIDRRFSGLGRQAYEEFFARVEDFIEEHPELTRIRCAAIVDSRNSVMSSFLERRGWNLPDIELAEAGLLSYSMTMDIEPFEATD